MATSYHTSLLTATDCRSHVHLIIGSNSLAGKRCEQSLATGAKPILVAPDPDTHSSPSPSSAQPLHYGLIKLIEAGQVTWLRQPFTESLLFTQGREEIDHVVDAVFLATTNAAALNAGAAHPEGAEQTTAPAISALCRRHRIPINVVDSPALCTFSLLSTHTDGPLQIGITTNGRGCHLASRIRREVAAALPPGLGAGCARLGEVRRRVQREDQAALLGAVEGEEEEGLDQAATFNRLVKEEDLDAAKTRRMRWLSQVCEYWPLRRLAALSDEDVKAVLESYNPGASTSSPCTAGDITTTSHSNTNDDSSNNSNPPLARGRIILAGSGPGHPDLLTRATHNAILTADVILADKLVPAGVLDLIPRRTPVSIARKYPGHAEQAQEELFAAALAAARQGKTVLRLKQGDPFVYGRGGEEVLRFRREGVPPERIAVLPGVTSALSAPLFAGVPPTQRDVADQVLVCTGTGKKGRPPAPPEFVASRTCVFLMALHRVGGLVAELTAYTAEELLAAGGASEGGDAETDKTETTTPTTTTSPDATPAARATTMTTTTTTKPTRALWPLSTPCAVIERASCPDQRVIRTTLRHVAEAVEAEGSRPPGLLVVGGACEVLWTPPPPPSSSPGGDNDGNGLGARARAWTVEEGFAGLLDAGDGVVGMALGAVGGGGASG